MRFYRLGCLLSAALFATALTGCGEGVSPTTPMIGEAGLASGSSPTAGHPSPKGGKASGSVGLSPQSLALAVGNSGWIYTTFYDKYGNALPDDNTRLMWYGCKPSDPALPSCAGYLSLELQYPNLCDLKLVAQGAGTFTVWVDDGNGHRAEGTVTVQ